MLKKFWMLLSYILLILAILGTIKTFSTGTIGLTIKGFICIIFALSLSLKNTLSNPHKIIDISLLTSCAILFLSDILYIFSGVNIFQ